MLVDKDGVHEARVVRFKAEENLFDRWDVNYCL
jgi:hypothetical protein